MAGAVNLFETLGIQPDAPVTEPQATPAPGGPVNLFSALNIKPEIPPEPPGTWEALGNKAADLGQKYIATPAAGAASAVLGMPKALKDLVKLGTVGALNTVREWSGETNVTPAAQVVADLNAATKPKIIPAPTEISAGDVRRGIDSAGNAVGVDTHRPAEGAFGRTVQGGIEGGMTGALIPFGGAVPAIASGVTGGATSEVLGELTKGSAAEPWARVLGAVAGGGAPILASHLLAPNAGSVLRQAVGDMTPEQAGRVEALLAAARNSQSPITALEAIQQVVGPNRRLATLQQVTEANVGPNSDLSQMIASRARANRDAMNRELDQIAPPVDQPQMIGPRVQEAAKTELANVREGINEKARPYYEASRSVEVTPHEFNTLAADPAFAEALQRVRAHPIKSAEIQGLPDHSIGVLDAVKKELNAMGQRSGNPLSPEADNFLTGLLSRGESRTKATATAASPEYETALAIGQEGRATKLAPLEEGALGKLAQSKDLQAQATALMDPQSWTLTPRQIRDTVERLRLHDPEATANVVRRALEVRFAEANQGNIAGPNAFGGAKFQSQIMGNDLQAQNLEALIRALPNGEAAWNGFNRLMEVMEAQGKRAQVGSNTAYNSQAIRELEAGNIGGPINVMSRGPWRRLQDWRERANLGQGSEQIARAITDPDGLRALRELSLASPTSDRAAALAARALGLSEQRD